MRNRLLILAGLALLALPACSVPTVEIQAGYAFLSLDGDVGYDNDQNAIAIEQDTKEAFGLGDVQGSPYVRAQLDLGVPVLTVSGFQFSDEGRGRLAEDFGSLPNINGGLPVQTGFDMFNAKVSYAFDIGIGPVAISPGIAIDYFDLQMDVQDAFGLAQESVDLNGPVPLGFLRASLDLEIVSAFAEVGYIGADVSDIKGSLLDAEAQLVLHPAALVELFVGYRYLNLQLDGEVDNDRIDTNLTISGFFVGGGILF